MNRPIRILHVLGGLNRGGAETMIMNLYRNIDRKKIQFDFVIHTDEECDYNSEIYNLGGKIFNFPRYSGKNHFHYKSKWKEFFTENPNYKIVHGHMRSTASIYLQLAKDNNITTIAHSHSISSRGNLIERIVKNKLQGPLKNIADYLFACSYAAGEWLYGANVKNDNFYIINNAINLQKFTYNKEIRETIRKKYNLEGKVVVGHVGNFTAPKNHLFLIEIFNDLQKEFEQCRLLLLGDGELKNQIVKKIESLNLADKVILLGNQDNINEYLQAMDLFVFPSLFEGLGMAVIEAQVSGLPCFISNRIPKEVIKVDLVKQLPLNNAQAWTRKISDELKFKNTKRISQINHFLDYDIKSVAKKLESFYLLV